MQESNSGERPVSTEDPPTESEKAEEFESWERDDVESVVDVSGRILDIQGLDEAAEDSVEGFYLYKNVFNLIPRSIGGVGSLKTLKFFANEINLFPEEFGNLVGLEHLQVKISMPGFLGLPLDKLKSLKELELCKVPPRPSGFLILSEIARLKRLTKLSICHFSIRCLPPEIGCLNHLEYLDLSFNKMKSLPSEITNLNALITLKVANNKLDKLPSGLSSLRMLENLDLSNNRLMSLGSLELGSMHKLRRLNLQYNKLLSFSEIPSWICCNLVGNGEDPSSDEVISSSTEMDMLESGPRGIHYSQILGRPTNSSSNRCFSAWKSSKGWKRRHYLQQRARQERLNCSRKWKVEDSDEILADEIEKYKASKLAAHKSESVTENSLSVPAADVDNKELLEEVEQGKLLVGIDDEFTLKKGFNQNECVTLESDQIHREGESALDSLSDATSAKGANLVLEVSNGNLKSKRHCERDLDSPKPRKSRRQSDGHLSMSSKYSTLSFCSIEDYIPDGFYDAGRDRPFLPLNSYDENMHLDAREVIVIDREMDEELDEITLRAQSFLIRFKEIHGSTKERGRISIDDLQIASLLALFVSDQFGGSDRSGVIERTRKAVSGSNYRKPFVCNCETGSSESVIKSMTQEDVVLGDLCERALQFIKERRHSIVVPIGTINFGVCRHRALLMKYLCDRMEPRVPCELVRGYLDFSPHAWNVVVLERHGSQIRMIVDACRPHDIREETDPEYFNRYIPLSRINFSAGIHDADCFLAGSASDEIEETTGSTTLMLCSLGSIEAAAKMRTLEVTGTSADEIRNFEFNCLGEIRLLSALKHPCIVEIFGHQITSKWEKSSDESPGRRMLQSAIFMEHVKGGSLKKYLEKLARNGKHHVPVEFALSIARDVANALAELHSKDVMHRDIKSENILIDLEKKKADGSPTVKLCDFDRAIPLRSSLHTCCIAHVGIPPPDVCVGTPRWMAPEVFQTMHERQIYGLEVDIWSFGCLLVELLTLEVPYLGLPDAEIHNLLRMGKRPKLTEELEDLGPTNNPEVAQSIVDPDGVEKESETLRILIDVYRQCTVETPSERPTADKLYKMLLSQSSSLSSSRSLKQE